MSYFFFKRVFDLLFSVLVIVFLLSWALPMLALLIKLDSPGPVFFFQKRVGKGGRPFICIKMRTMVVNPLADQLPAGREDGRITRLGGWLRRSYLDELPQFFNVLLGSMSLVGPRPYMLTDNQVFTRIVAEHPMRYTIKPGITGMAQIKGLHGPLSERDGAVVSVGMGEREAVVVTRFQWDIFYIRNANFLLDIDIIRRSIHLLFTQQMRA